MMIGVSVVMAFKHQSACDLSGLCHQFGAVPDGLELLRYWKLPLWNNQDVKMWKIQHGFNTPGCPRGL